MTTDGSTSGASSFTCTCTMDGIDHLVSDDAATLGIAARRGTYTAMCGHLVYVAALTSSAGPLCSRCVHLTHQVQAPVAISHRRNDGRSRARLGQLLGLPKSWLQRHSAMETDVVNYLANKTRPPLTWNELPPQH